ncbi:MAG TPA: PIG-L deacetylase family protein [Polyangia bacterium]|jgi:LmbE family N-acetylglucosaminyl deacetylase
MRRILVVAAHPDDEMLGCGASMAKWTAQGYQVSIAILGEGATSRYGSREAGPSHEISALQKAALAAAEVVGVKDVTFHGLPDNRFDSLPLLEVVKVVEKRVMELAPERVVTHHGGDLNVDHRTTYHAVLTATRPKPGHPVKELLAFEVASSTEWGFQTIEPAFRANHFEDVTGTMTKKLEALAAYATEMCPFPHPRSTEAVAAIARRWGSVVGCEAAEAFQLIRGLH